MADRELSKAVDFKEPEVVSGSTTKGYIPLKNNKEYQNFLKRLSAYYFHRKKIPNMEKEITYWNKKKQEEKEHKAREKQENKDQKAREKQEYNDKKAREKQAKQDAKQQEKLQKAKDKHDLAQQKRDLEQKDRAEKEHETLEENRHKLGIKQVSTLRPRQEELYDQLVNAGLAPGAGGAIGNAADYHRNLLSDESKDFDAFAAPELRKYNEEIVPGLSEQFAGMGAGGLSSSGFRNAQVQGATDLSERLGGLRAQLRQSAAQNLQNIGMAGLNNFSENVRLKPQATGKEKIAEGVGQGIGNAATALVNEGVNYLKNGSNNNANLQAKGLSSPQNTKSVSDNYEFRNPTQTPKSVGGNSDPYDSRNIPASPNVNSR